MNTFSLTIDCSALTSAATITSTAAADTMIGSNFEDWLNGGGGDDTYVASQGDTIIESLNGGTDLVRSGATQALSDNVENLTLTGVAAINGKGNLLANIIIGNDGANVLDGAGGADRFEGGLGNDTYITDGGDTIVEAANAGSDTIRSSVASTLSANFENLTLIGTAGVIGTGNGVANILNGLLNTGANVLSGLDGADLYIVGAGDVATEITSGEAGGADTVQSGVTYALGDNIEHLKLTGTASINGTGNYFDNTITGNGGSNVLDGVTGADRLVGGLGSDTYVTEGGDTIVEAANQGADTVKSSVDYTLGANIENLLLTGLSALGGTGNSLANTITGNSAANALNGATGIDRLVGRSGNDTYITDGGDTIVEVANQGTDTVKASVDYKLDANVENLSLTGSAAIAGTGNSLANTITGNSAANILNGVTGIDRLVGGNGNDTYITESGDTIVEAANQGIDLVQSSGDHTLSSNVDNLTLIGANAINGTGNSLNNTIIGNSAANVLNGGTGFDRLFGSNGNDTYIIDGGDAITEASNQGTDTVRSSATYVLGINIEHLTLTGTSTINGTGNSLANIIRGNAGINVLEGGSGADKLAGGLGIDTLFGGSGNDAFVFDTRPTAATNRDIITDFSNTSTNNDVFQLDNAIFTKLGSETEALNAAYFKLSTQAQDANDYIVYNNETGGLLYDADGNGGAAGVQFAMLFNNATLTAADFVLI
ncbi:Ca2+-binding RTX toxin-like protein [Pararhizobium capsulatum DSM 1112]|uniref:Ca2+-binding RTX toxin-like protein n=1 Tax=Pararhizobium capsulatum DSM 1112 TaxID=1121113 RepID=A0ABU0C158_9HYPH|nr:calcium-binding protein [Pararhizobium capsulatum]MDQ0323664.1 Ca2+-binding RTX toxin-like protein [Pararhizobium capsulatum DSM 1112]